MPPPQTTMSHPSGTCEAVSETTVSQIAPRDVIRPAFRTNKGASSPGSRPQPTSAAAASSSASGSSSTVIRPRGPKSAKA
eukprot:12061548-Prorocentrum_lima.AAC.1